MWVHASPPVLQSLIYSTLDWYFRSRCSPSLCIYFQNHRDYHQRCWCSRPNHSSHFSRWIHGTGENPTPICFYGVDCSLLLDSRHVSRWPSTVHSSLRNSWSSCSRPLPICISESDRWSEAEGCSNGHGSFHSWPGKSSGTSHCWCADHYGRGRVPLCSDFQWDYDDGRGDDSFAWSAAGMEDESTISTYGCWQPLYPFN